MQTVLRFTFKNERNVLSFVNNYSEMINVHPEKEDEENKFIALTYFQAYPHASTNSMNIYLIVLPTLKLENIRSQFHFCWTRSSTLFLNTYNLVGFFKGAIPFTANKNRIKKTFYLFCQDEIFLFVTCVPISRNLN